jgi:hypothetical protein
MANRTQGAHKTFTPEHLILSTVRGWKETKYALTFATTILKNFTIIVEIFLKIF